MDWIGQYLVWEFLAVLGIGAVLGLVAWLRGDL